MIKFRAFSLAGVATHVACSRNGFPLLRFGDVPLRNALFRYRASYI